MLRKMLFLTLLLTLLLPAVQAQDAVSDLLGRINTLRGELGLHPYTLHPALTAAAQNHASWMANSTQVGHVQPDGSRPRDRAAAAGYASSWVSENIYMGSNASVDSAWNFWINSSVHYAGLTSPNYQHIGIATASGAYGQAFVLVFGAPGGSVSSASDNTGNSAGAQSAAPAAPPSYVVGVDARGNIMHEVQPGDTLGDIALIYGYTWEDIPYMLELNDMSDADIRALEVGSVFLVPPQGGTYTPTPEPERTAEATAPAEVTPEVTNEVIAEATPEATNDFTPESVAPTATDAGLVPPEVFAGTLTPTPTQTATPSPTATPSSTQAALQIGTPPPSTQVAMVVDDSTSAPAEPGSPPQDSGMPGWLVAAIVVQVGVLGFASLEFLRRLLRK